MSIPTYEGLLGSARFFANRALRDSTSDDQFGVLLDAGTLIEHLSKALLISKNPAYLVESKANNFDHLLHLTGQGGRAPLTGAVRTIGAYEAVARVRKLADIRTPQTDLDQVLQVRNGIVHAGAFDETRTRQLLTACLRYCDEVYDALDVSERWGEHIEWVVSLKEQSWTDIEHEYHRKVTAAKARFRALMDQIPESEQASVAAARQSVMYSFAARAVYQSSGGNHYSALVTCPVCNHDGALCRGPLRIEHELTKSARFDEPDSLDLVDIWVEPETLQCRVCGVTLSNADELRLAGVPSRVEFRLPAGMDLPSPPPNDFYDDGPWTTD